MTENEFKEALAKAAEYLKNNPQAPHNHQTCPCPHHVCPHCSGTGRVPYPAPSVWPYVQPYPYWIQPYWGVAPTITVSGTIAQPTVLTVT